MKLIKKAFILNIIFIFSIIILSSCNSYSSDGISYSLTDDGTYEVVGMSDYSNVNVKIPSKYYGTSVTAIAREAFLNFNSLESVVIPSSVTEISYAAFEGCTSLTSVTLNEGLLSISNYAFSGCTSLTSMIIPSTVTDFGSFNVFENCTSLTDVDFLCTDSGSDLGNYYFSGCTSLVNVELEDVTMFGISCFQDCTSLTNITIPDTVEKLRDYCFSGCTSLTNLNLPSNLEQIREGCFENCSSLIDITIPEKVYVIYAQAFLDCSSLTSVSFDYTSYWYIAGTDKVDVTDSTENAQYLTETYYSKYFVNKILSISES